MFLNSLIGFAQRFLNLLIGFAQKKRFCAFPNNDTPDDATFSGSMATQGKHEGVGLGLVGTIGATHTEIDQVRVGGGALSLARPMWAGHTEIGERQLSILGTPRNAGAEAAAARDGRLLYG